VNTEPLRLRLLNDYEVVVAGLRAMLEPFDDRVRVVEEDIRSISGRRVDLTLYDTFGRTLDEQRNLGELVADPATGTVVVYAWNAREAATEGDGEASGVEYLDKSLPAAELVASLERIAGRGVAPGAAAPRERPAAVRLAEPQVVALITQGHTNPEIAASLYLSLNSLKSYIRSAYRKMGVERRSQAVRWGIEHGMLPPRKGEH
jgi:DNA-binding NarL/FixJ family response regulator